LNDGASRILALRQAQDEDANTEIFLILSLTKDEENHAVRRSNVGAYAVLDGFCGCSVLFLESRLSRSISPCINAVFLARLQPFNCRSAAMASMMFGKCPDHTSLTGRRDFV